MYYLHEHARTRHRYRGPGHRGAGRPARLGLLVFAADGPERAAGSVSVCRVAPCRPEGTSHRACAVIECAREKRIEPLRPPEKPWNVLVQQIFLHVLSASRAAGERSCAIFSRSLSFRTFPLRTWTGSFLPLSLPGYLSADGEMLVLGPEAERVFGRSNTREYCPRVIPGGGDTGLAARTEGGRQP